MFNWLLWNACSEGLGVGLYKQQRWHKDFCLQGLKFSVSQYSTFLLFMKPLKDKYILDNSLDHFYFNWKLI
jgi:hypothetical protein